MNDDRGDIERAGILMAEDVTTSGYTKESYKSLEQINKELQRENNDLKNQLACLMDTFTHKYMALLIEQKIQLIKLIEECCYDEDFDADLIINKMKEVISG